MLTKYIKNIFFPKPNVTAYSHALRDAIGSIILQLQLDSLSEIPVTEFNLIILS